MRNLGRRAGYLLGALVFTAYALALRAYGWILRAWAWLSRPFRRRAPAMGDADPLDLATFVRQIHAGPPPPAPRTRTDGGQMYPQAMIDAMRAEMDGAPQVWRAAMPAPGRENAAEQTMPWAMMEHPEE